MKFAFWVSGQSAVAALVILSGFPAHAQSLPVDAPGLSVTTSTEQRSPSPAAQYRPAGIGSRELSALDGFTSISEPVAFDPATMMATEDVRPGMKGYGLSVFSGLEPERFEAEVIGVRQRMMAGTDIILCRLKSPHLVELGVIAGMSGSPVYIDGKLIGAVAYGFIDVDDPLAGVTPIADMLRVYNSTPTTPAQGPDSATAGLSGLNTFDGYMALRQNPSLDNLQKIAHPPAMNAPLKIAAAEFGSDIAERYGLPEALTLEPLSSPVLLSSENPLTPELAKVAFPSLNITPAGQPASAMSAGSAPAFTLIPDSMTSGGVPSPLAANSPGGPVADLAAFADNIIGGHALAVPLIEGDLNMAVVGTVSWRHKDRLVAFGHPMTQGGTVYLPMAAARINALVRSRTRPFKLGEPVGHIGMVRQDRLPAVGGLFGQTAKMFNLKTIINDPRYGSSRQYSYRIFNDRHLSPGLLMTALGETVSAAARSDGESAALFSYSLQLDDGTSISAENFLSDTGGTLQAIFGVMADAGSLLNNPYKPVDLTAVEFHMQITDKLREARLEAAALDKKMYHPGETATLEWVLRPFRSEPVKMRYDFAVPENLPDGTYTIVVNDSDARQDLENKRHPAGRKPNDFEDLVRLIRQNFSDNRIYISLVDQDTGVAVNGKELPRLPASIISSIQETVDPEYFAAVRGNFIIDADLATNLEISGSLNTELVIKRR